MFILAIGALPLASRGADAVEPVERADRVPQAEIGKEGDSNAPKALNSLNPLNPLNALQAPVGTASTSGEDKGKSDQEKSRNQPSNRALERRSVVASAVQELLAVADRTGGIGQQIRTIAQSQNDNDQEIETKIKIVKNRGRLLKFFFGPDYKNLNSVEDRLNYQEQQLAELRQLSGQVTDEKDAVKVTEQVKAIEAVNAELRDQIKNESKGFSLFGWLNKLLSK